MPRSMFRLLQPRTCTALLGSAARRTRAMPRLLISQASASTGRARGLQTAGVTTLQCRALGSTMQMAFAPSSQVLMSGTTGQGAGNGGGQGKGHKQGQGNGKGKVKGYGKANGQGKAKRNGHQSNDQVDGGKGKGKGNRVFSKNTRDSYTNTNPIARRKALRGGSKGASGATAASQAQHQGEQSRHHSMSHQAGLGRINDSEVLLSALDTHILAPGAQPFPATIERGLKNLVAPLTTLPAHSRAELADRILTQSLTQGTPLTSSNADYYMRLLCISTAHNASIPVHALKQRLADCEQSPDMACRTSLLRSFASVGDVASAYKEFDAIHNKSLEHYVSLILAHAQCHDMQGLMNVVLSARPELPNGSATTLSNVAAEQLAAHSDTDRLQELLQILNDDGIAVPQQTMNAVISAQAALGQQQAVHDSFQWLREAMPTRTALIDHQEQITSAALYGTYEEMSTAISQAVIDGVEVALIVGPAVSALGARQDTHRLTALLNLVLTSDGVEFHHKLQEAFAVACGNTGSFEFAMQTMNTVRAVTGCAPSPEYHHACFQTLLNDASLSKEQAEAKLKIISEAITQDGWNSDRVILKDLLYLNAKFQLKDSKSFAKMLERYDELFALRDSGAWHALLWSHQDDESQQQDVLELMAANHMSPTYETYRILVESAIARSDLDGAKQYFSVAMHNNAVPTTTAHLVLPILRHVLSTAGYEAALELLDELHQSTQFAIGRETLTVILDECQRAGNVDAAVNAMGLIPDLMFSPRMYTHIMNALAGINTAAGTVDPDAPLLFAKNVSAFSMSTAFVDVLLSIAYSTKTQAFDKAIAAEIISILEGKNVPILSTQWARLAERYNVPIEDISSVFSAWMAPSTMDSLSAFFVQEPLKHGSNDHVVSSLLELNASPEAKTRLAQNAISEVSKQSLSRALSLADELVTDKVLTADSAYPTVARAVMSLKTAPSQDIIVKLVKTMNNNNMTCMSNLPPWFFMSLATVGTYDLTAFFQFLSNIKTTLSKQNIDRIAQAVTNHLKSNSDTDLKDIVQALEGMDVSLSKEIRLALTRAYSSQTKMPLFPLSDEAGIREVHLHISTAGVTKENLGLVRKFVHQSPESAVYLLSAAAFHAGKHAKRVSVSDTLVSLLAKLELPVELKHLTHATAVLNTSSRVHCQLVTVLSSHYHHKVPEDLKEKVQPFALRAGISNISNVTGSKDAHDLLVLREQGKLEFSAADYTLMMEKSDKNPKMMLALLKDMRKSRVSFTSAQRFSHIYALLYQRAHGDCITAAQTLLEKHFPLSPALSPAELSLYIKCYSAMRNVEGLRQVLSTYSAAHGLGMLSLRDFVQCIRCLGLQGYASEAIDLLGGMMQTFKSQQDASPKKAKEKDLLGIVVVDIMSRLSLEESIEVLRSFMQYNLTPPTKFFENVLQTVLQDQPEHSWALTHSLVTQATPKNKHNMLGIFMMQCLKQRRSDLVLQAVRADEFSDDLIAEFAKASAQRRESGVLEAINNHVLKMENPSVDLLEQMFILRIELYGKLGQLMAHGPTILSQITARVPVPSVALLDCVQTEWANLESLEAMEQLRRFAESYSRSA
eukprot:m.315606 g.315606  ORF g.315606 m.315606 type:complete len:1581 (-) comp15973_c0_seq53:140-4882(-)